MDEQTARALDRTCRWLTAWRRRVVPAVLLAECLAGSLGVVAVLHGWGRAAAVPLLAQLVALLALWAASVGVHASLSLHHPTLRRGFVLIRHVDANAAAAWFGLNPDAGMELLVRGGARAPARRAKDLVRSAKVQR
ncbi:MAG TPA: hypothetical protein VH561_01985 [Micromonosporaceae bacterium]